MFDARGEVVADGRMKARIFNEAAEIEQFNFLAASNPSTTSYWIHSHPLRTYHSAEFCEEVYGYGWERGASKHEPCLGLAASVGANENENRRHSSGYS